MKKVFILLLFIFVPKINAQIVTSVFRLADSEIEKGYTFNVNAIDQRNGLEITPKITKNTNVKYFQRENESILIKYVIVIFKDDKFYSTYTMTQDYIKMSRVIDSFYLVKHDSVVYQNNKIEISLIDLVDIDSEKCLD